VPPLAVTADKQCDVLWRCGEGQRQAANKVVVCIVEKMSTAALYDPNWESLPRQEPIGFLSRVPE